jgi:uroporphyrinogen-III decarboxylase
MDHPVKNMDDWLRIKPWYQFSEARFERDWQAIAQRYREEDRVLCVSMPGGFDEPRQLLGEEELYVSYYTQPELIHDVLDTIGHTAVQVFDRVASEVQVDLLRVHEDMAERAGPLAGPKQVDEFIKPYYRRVWDRIQERGAQLFDQDSDGDMSSVIPSFLAAGINYMHPVEPVDNMDIVELRAQYGQRLAFYGGLDKHVLREGKEAIAAELEHKMPPLIKSGGCVLALDHRIPNGTPLENYRFYIEKSWEIIERES